MILYTLFRFLSFLLMLFPYALRKQFFLVLGALAYALDRQHRNVIRRNLDLAYGDSLPHAQRQSIMRYCYRNLMLNFLQVLENRHTKADKLKKHVRFENRAIVDQAREAGRAIVFISGHYGNWEIGLVSIASEVIPLVSIHKPLNNAYFNRYLLEARTRFDVQMIEKKGALKHLALALKKGKAVSLMIDQNLNRKESSIVDFFGHPTTQTPAASSLARKFNALIIPVFIHTEDERLYTVRFEEAIEVAHTDNAEADIQEATQRQAEVMERIIRAEPKFWFWCHRRWKAGIPGVYRDE